jgi:hypothetical protein
VYDNPDPKHISTSFAERTSNAENLACDGGWRYRHPLSSPSAACVTRKKDYSAAMSDTPRFLQHKKKRPPTEAASDFLQFEKAIYLKPIGNT